MYWLRTDITIDSPIDTTFNLFCDATNLEKLTPPELRFEIISPLPIEMKRGAEIEYRIRLFGVPFSWHTEITVWEPGVRFVDEQVAGPFRKWIHEHRFESVGDSSTRIRDEVAYELPLEPVGRLAHPLVRSRLKRVFDFREREVRSILSGSPPRGWAHTPAPNSIPPITREVSF